MRAEYTFWTVTGATILLSCASRSSTGPNTTTAPGEKRPATVQEGAVCDPGPGKDMRILDERLTPVDMNSEKSVLAVAGRAVILCAPVRRETTGRLLDQNSSAPIPGATVTIESWQTYPPIGGLQPNRRLIASAQVRTDATGRWFVAAESRWMRGILAADGFPYFISSYCAEASGYQHVLLDPWTRGGPITGPDLDEIKLQEGPTRPTPSARNRRSMCGIPLDPALE